MCEGENCPYKNAKATLVCQEETTSSEYSLCGVCSNLNIGKDKVEQEKKVFQIQKNGRKVERLTFKPAGRTTRRNKGTPKTSKTAVPPTSGTAVRTKIKELSSDEVKKLKNPARHFKPDPSNLHNPKVWQHTLLIAPDDKDPPDGGWKTSDALFAYCKKCDTVLDYHWKSNSKTVQSHYMKQHAREASDATARAAQSAADATVHAASSSAAYLPAAPQVFPAMPVAQTPLASFPTGTLYFQTGMGAPNNHNPEACVCASASGCRMGGVISPGTTTAKCGPCQKWMHQSGCSYAFIPGVYLCQPCAISLGVPINQTPPPTSNKKTEPKKRKYEESPSATDSSESTPSRRKGRRKRSRSDSEDSGDHDRYRAADRKKRGGRKRR